MSIIDKKQRFYESLELSGALLEIHYTEKEILALAIPNGETAYVSDVNGNLWKCTPNAKTRLIDNTELVKTVSDLKLGRLSQKDIVTDSEIGQNGLSSGKIIYESKPLTENLNALSAQTEGNKITIVQHGTRINANETAITALQNGKENKIAGKGLSTNDFSNYYKDTLSLISGNDSSFTFDTDAIETRNGRCLAQKQIGKFQRATQRGKMVYDWISIGNMISSDLENVPYDLTLEVAIIPEGEGGWGYWYNWQHVEIRYLDHPNRAFGSTRMYDYSSDSVYTVDFMIIGSTLFFRCAESPNSIFYLYTNRVYSLPSLLITT